MTDVVDNAPQEFWRPPSLLDADASGDFAPRNSPTMAEACSGCGSEYMIQAKFCHTCGLTRFPLRQTGVLTSDAAVVAGWWVKKVAQVRSELERLGSFGSRLYFPPWLRYLHFHEIKRWVGLPTAALIAFIIGLGCVAGAVSVSLFFKASNLAEFQAIQMWRIEWLLGATASFVAGILLKHPSEADRE